MGARGPALPPGKSPPLPPSQGPSLQSRLLLTRRWSTPLPTLDLYAHYHGVNENEAELRAHRAMLCRTADGRSRDRHRAAFDSELSVAAATATIRVSR